jgi:hypothetical protein
MKMNPSFALHSKYNGKNASGVLSTEEGTPEAFFNIKKQGVRELFAERGSWVGIGIRPAAST